MSGNLFWTKSADIVSVLGEWFHFNSYIMSPFLKKKKQKTIKII